MSHPTTASSRRGKPRRFALRFPSRLTHDVIPLVQRYFFIAIIKELGCDMAYQYSFDRTTVGNFRLRREKYKLLQECYQIMLNELQSWNRKALEHDAPRPPYEQEVEDLKSMIEWGKERLATNKRTFADIVVNGISVGSLCYAKAAVLFGVNQKEKELKEKSKNGWPSHVIKSIDQAIDRLRDIEQSIEFPPADILWELIQRPKTKDQIAKDKNIEWDIFISHASEDKDAIARPLAQALDRAELLVWYDETTLKLGDNLRRSIERGLRKSRYGIVILSHDFFAKKWPQAELDGLFAQEQGDVKKIIPIWHRITHNDILKYSPVLADRVAVDTALGLDVVVEKILQLFNLENVRYDVNSSDELSSNLDSFVNSLNETNDLNTEKQTRDTKIGGLIEKIRQSNFSQIGNFLNQLRSIDAEKTRFLFDRLELSILVEKAKRVDFGRLANVLSQLQKIDPEKARCIFDQIELSILAEKAKLIDLATLSSALNKLKRIDSQKVGYILSSIEVD